MKGGQCSAKMPKTILKIRV